MAVRTTWRERARALRRDVMTLWFALRDPRTPRLARWLAALVVAYALSPIDLIPDFIPVLGYLDDLILVPLGIALVLRMIPAQVIETCRAQAAQVETRPRNWLAAALIVLVWVALALLAGWVAWDLWRS
jgi:uncharacterized membrane protein YkvA (DUF1232 family)